jgi:hypothetical protein
MNQNQQVIDIELEEFGFIRNMKKKKKYCFPKSNYITKRDIDRHTRVIGIYFLRTLIRYVSFKLKITHGDFIRKIYQLNLPSR